MMINVLGISASPRRYGNSEILLDRLLDGAKSRGASVKKVVLNERRLKPCQECEACRKVYVCAVKDDMPALFKLFDEADVVVISSPIYFGSITAQLKTMIDRFQPLWVKKEIHKKAPLRPKQRKGIFLCVSAVKRIEYFEHAKKTIKILFSLLNIKYSHEVYCSGLDKKGDIRKRKEILKRAILMGEELAMEK